jgi:1,4-dihydroxy-2-naphthoate octaprenyltransferase
MAVPGIQEHARNDDPRGWRRWWVAARPRTLTMAATPVVVGAALAWNEGAGFHAGVLALTLACAMLIQVATNLLNDVADFERGNDRDDRVGPLRITAAGLATPAEVRRAAVVAFAVALALGVWLVWLGGPAILAVGLLSLAAGWAYSGGRRPISHGALGELWVLLFFGVVAVWGSHYLQAGGGSPLAVAFGVALGAMAAAVLLLNNYRDLEPDRCAGRRTLAALLGPEGARRLFAVLMLSPLVLPAWLALAHPGRHQWLWLSWLVLPLLLGVVARMRRRVGPALNPVLGQAAMAQFAFGALVTLGLVL